MSEPHPILSGFNEENMQLFITVIKRKKHKATIVSKALSTYTCSLEDHRDRHGGKKKKRYLEKVLSNEEKIYLICEDAKKFYKEFHNRPCIVERFIYTFFGLGLSLCLITCSGHIAAETANGHCLSCYMVFVFFLVVLEAAITVDIFLNRNWEEDFPEDETGRFNELKDFVKSNFDMCKWIGLGIVGVQAMSILLAMVLRALGSEQRGSYYDSDDEYVPARLPLLRNQVQHAPYIVDPHLAIRNDSWNTRTNEKVNRG